MPHLVLLTLIALGCAATALADPSFEDVTAVAGVTHQHQNRQFDNPYAHIMAGYTALGASVAVADFDSDGYDDFYLTSSSAKGSNALYRNNGDFTFSDVAAPAGVADCNDKVNASADALWFDYNGDGRQDLFVVRFGRSLLFENRGESGFREVSKRAGLDRYANAITAIAFDYDRDGDLDLFVGSYFQPVNVFDPDTPRFFPESFETANNGGGLTLWRNDGEGTFTDVTLAAGFDISGWTLDLGHADYDNDGDEDLYVAADFGTDRLFRNEGDGTFKDVTLDTIGIDTKKGMNVDWADYDNDGWLDVYVTNITDEYMREENFLWRNGGDGSFIDVARETGTWETGWGWGARFFDYDNDGYQDLYVTNGWVSAGEENYVVDVFEMIVTPGIDLADARNWPPMNDKTLSGYQRNRLFRNDGIGFQEVGESNGVASLLDARGVAVADFDNDGHLDFVVANAGKRPQVFRNIADADRNWVQFRVAARGPSTGTVVRLSSGGQAQMRYVDGGNSFAGQSSQTLHFGLGSAEAIEAVEVRWPDGTTEQFVVNELNRRWDLRQGEGQ